MIRGRCPVCAKTFEIAALAELPSFPFCTERCRLVDLGRWIDGRYAIPANEAPATQPPDANGDGPVEDAD